ncbi:MAG: UDP-phosphate glycosylphosphotransferase [Acidimicrobiaceae bacterium]|nr:UDP-phosphate glycosylphosphotransferase [Acidimicrobiaceae bacterium]
MGGQLDSRLNTTEPAATSHEVDIPVTPDISANSDAPALALAAPVPRRLKSWLLAADTAAVLIALVMASGAMFVVRDLPGWLDIRHFLLGLASLPGFAIGASFNRMYLARANERPSEEAGNIARTVAVGVGTVVLIAFLIQFKELSRLWVVLFGIGSFVALVSERRLARAKFRRLRRSGRLTRPIVIVGTDPNAIGLMHTYLRNPDQGYRVVGFVGDDDIGERAGVGVLGRIDELDLVLEQTQAVGVIISQSSVGHDDLNAMTRRLTDQGYHVALSSTLTDIDITRLRPQQLDGRTMIYVEPVRRDGWRAVAKRFFDVVAAVSLLVVTLPISVATIIAIRLEGPGPILFRQQRVGRDGELFTMTKFRTMVPDAEARRAELAALNEADGPLFKMTHDPRITRVGRILRKLSIDELPQLVSVIVGDMSMVGPRPALPSEIEDWDEALHERLRVLPGLTGMWQVSGRSDSSFEQYRRLDLYYVHNWSLAHDLRICLRTVSVVLTGRGAS